MIDKPLGELLTVKWRDIVTWDGWLREDKIGEECFTPHVCLTTGFLTHVAPDFIVVSATRGKNGTTEYNQHITIPKGCIIEIG